MPVAEKVTAYAARPEGSESKLNTYRDGFRISTPSSRCLGYERPLLFFGFIAMVLALMSIILGIPLVITVLI